MSEIESTQPPVEKKSTKRRKMGILGVPADKPILFSFTSKELWPDAATDSDDVDSDDDYRPSESSAAPKPKKATTTSPSENVKKKPRAASRNVDYEEEGASSNTELIGSQEDEDDEEYEYSAKAPPKSNFDTWNGKGKKQSKKRAPAKAAKTNGKPPAKKQKLSGQASKRSTSSTTSNKKSSSTSQSNGSSSKGTKGAKSSKWSSKSGNFTDFNLLKRQVREDFEQVFPPELLTKIFVKVLESEQKHAQTLIKLSQVCENWRGLIISSPILWQRLDLNGFPDVHFPLATFQELNTDNALFSCVKEVNLSGWSSAAAERLIAIVADGANFDLELLSVKNCRNISSKCFDIIIGRCPNLQSLDLSSITYYFGHNIEFFDSIQSWARHGRGRQIALNNALPPSKQTSAHQTALNPFTAAVLRPLMETCGANLKQLYVSENMMPSFPAVMSIVMDLCPKLEVLDVSNVASLGGRSTSISVDKLQRSCPNLRVLRAANINFTPTICSGSAPPVPGFPLLEELSIPFHESFMVPLSMLDGNTDWTLELLTKGAENLSLLDIRGSRYISPRGLLKIPTWSLKHLSISNCTKLEDDTMEMVITKWNKTLVDVDLSWNKSERCMATCIEALCAVDQDEPGSSQLKSIQLRGSAITYDSLRALLKHCPLLSSIDLQSCRSLPRGIKRAYDGDEFALLRTELLEGKYE